MSTYEVVEGDCLAVMAGMADASVDAVITDPPYFLPATHYNTRKSFARSLSDLAILEHFYRDFFTEAARVIRPEGVFYVFCDGQSYPVFYATLYRHVRRLMPLIWDKQTAINGYSWRHQHEMIVFGEMPKAPAVPTGDGDIIRCRAVKVDDRVHPAEKPVELLQRLIVKSVPEGGIVLDPFCGSAPTGVAAYNCGRSFIGIEREVDYCAIARRRIAEAAAQPKLALPA